MNKYTVTTLKPDGPGSLSEGMKWASSTETRIIDFAVSGVIKFPEDCYLRRYQGKPNPAEWKNCRNLEIRADRAPGHVIISGSPVWLVNPEDVRMYGLTFLLDEPVDPRPINSWGTLRVIAEVPLSSRNVLFQNCAFIGGADEVAVCPTDPWPKPDVSAPYTRNISFLDCFFGYGTTKARGYHNHALAATLVEGLVFGRNFIAHENRRCPQVDGTSLIFKNVIYNFGTMGIGFYRGDHKVTQNIFVRGPQSRNNPPVAMLQIAESDRVGVCSVQRCSNVAFAVTTGPLTNFTPVVGPKPNEAIDVRNPKVTLIDTLLQPLPLSLEAIYTSGPFVNGLRLPQVTRARDEFLSRSGAWVSTLSQAGLL